MNLNEYAKKLCEQEGKKKQIDIAQMKEILKIIAEDLYIESDVLLSLLNYGEKCHRKSYEKFVK